MARGCSHVRDLAYDYDIEAASFTSRICRHDRGFDSEAELGTDSPGRSTGGELAMRFEPATACISGVLKRSAGLPSPCLGAGGDDMYALSRGHRASFS